MSFGGATRNGYDGYDIADNIAEDLDEEEEMEEYHYDSRCPGIVNAIAIHSPLILLGALCSISTVLYNITETRMIHTDSQDLQTPYCTGTKYLQLLNGVCTRGQVFDLDPVSDCIQWSDLSQWEDIDAENKFRFTLYDTQARFFPIKNKTYAVTDLAQEAADFWPIWGNYAYGAIACSFMNLMMAVGALDSDYFHNRLGIMDVDKLVLIGSTLTVGASLTFFGFFGYITYYDSEMTVAESWTNPVCDFTTTPTIGMYVLIISTLFSVSSILMSTSTFVYWYLFVDCFEWFIPIDEEEEAEKAAKLEGEKEAADKFKQEEAYRKAMENKADLEKGPHSPAKSLVSSPGPPAAFNNKVAPSPAAKVAPSPAAVVVMETPKEPPARRQVATIISPTALSGKHIKPVTAVPAATKSKAKDKDTDASSTKKNKDKAKAKDIEDKNDKASKVLGDELQNEKSKEHKKTEERLDKKKKQKKAKDKDSKRSSEETRGVELVATTD